MYFVYKTSFSKFFSFVSYQKDKRKISIRTNVKVVDFQQIINLDNFYEERNFYLLLFSNKFICTRSHSYSLREIS